MAGEGKSGRGRLKRLRALKRLRVQRRHIRHALMATTPTAALLGLGGMVVPKAAVPVAVAATALPAVAHAAESAVEEVDLPPLAHDTETVEASYYGDEFAGRPTASGETFDPELMTAAHRTLPFGSLVQVTEALSGKSVTVRINDRGPFHGDRAIDLSEAAARQIGLIAQGAGKVTLRLLSQA
jgi:rare lipoprotein A